MWRFTLCLLFLLLLFLTVIIKPPTINASWIKYSNKPVVPVGPINSWDQKIVASASIIFDGSLFKMWYEGSNGSIGRIGYATSNDGIVWNKNPTYVVDTIDTRDNVNVHDPKVISINSKFKMWYAASDSFINNIHINYTESLNGIDWNSSQINVMSASLSWERDVSFPYTLLLNTEYKMWYGARGSYNGSSIKWRIGYATSTDGITWTKNPTPIIEVTQSSWEGKDVANPCVLFDETTGTYEMFYHGDYGIGRATSFDGKNWTKDPANPILVPTAGTFDSQRVFNPYVLKKDGIYYMWYTGVNTEGKWQIGLATSEAIPVPPPTETPTAVPSPTPTASPTPTPTYTPTPSPTPSSVPNFSPIIIVPGLGASWNPKDIFACSADSSGKWELAPYVTIYNRLIKTLTENAGLKLNQDIYLYTYDWRQPLDKQADNFKKYLDNLLKTKPAGTKVRLVGHSLGGLVVRSYLAHNPNLHPVVSVLTVGTPHQGTVDTYPIWEKGEIAINDLLLQITIDQIINHCRVIKTFILPKKEIPIFKFRSNREIVQYFIPVVKQLLPTFNYLKRNSEIIETSALKSQNDWVPEHPMPSNRFNVNFFTLSGENNSTSRYLNVAKPSIREQAFGDWIDGKPIGKETSNLGDGTILELSSQIAGADNESISGSHADIISKDEAILKILKFLDIPQIPVAAALAPLEEVSNSAIVISIRADVKIKVATPVGKIQESDNGLIVSFNPETGIYHLEITANKSGIETLFVSQIVKGKEPKDLTFPLVLSKNQPARFYLTYNPQNTPVFQLITL